MSVEDVASAASEICDTADITNTAQTYGPELLDLAQSAAASQASEALEIPGKTREGEFEDAAPATVDVPEVGRTKLEIRATFGTSLEDDGDHGGCLWKVADGRVFEVVFSADAETGCFADDSSKVTDVYAP
ncbi:MAG: hypothetical protein Q7T73_22475 [Beijerinckiaceae bacterium]|nr:hypothetical protein [Beijerinckiaceae bacterium]